MNPTPLLSANANSSHRYHLEDPYVSNLTQEPLREPRTSTNLSCLVCSYWQTFDKYVIPLLDKPMDLRRYNELDTSQEVKVEQDPALWEAVKKHQSQS